MQHEGSPPSLPHSPTHTRLRRGEGLSRETGEQNKWHPLQMLKKHTFILSSAYQAAFLKYLRMLLHVGR